MISMCMLKLYQDSIWRPLEIIINCLREVKFPDEWKKSYLDQSLQKTLNKFYLIVNLFPSFQLTVTSKRLIYNSMYKFISDNNLLSPHQSGFELESSCINQLLLIIYDIFPFFDERIETRTTTLDI